MLYEVITVPAGTSVSYHATWSAPRPTTLATLAIGYADGVPRALSNRGMVAVHDRAVPIVFWTIGSRWTSNTSA